MNKFMTAMGALALTMGTAACNSGAEGDTATATADGTLAGTWKLDPSSAQFENANDKYVFADGKYTCESCIPSFSVAADGEWQAVDRPGSDGLKIAIVDDKTISSASRLGDKQLGESTWTVSDDGSTMSIAWTNMSGKEVVKGTTQLERVAAGPDGSHAASGEWKVKQIGEMDEAGLTVEYAVDGDTITYSGNGDSFTATLGGDAVKLEGDEANGMIAIEKTGDNSYRETYTRDGEVINVLEYTIEGDKLTATATDPRDKSVVKWSATRQ